MNWEAALVLWLIGIFVILAICSDSKRRDQAHARAIHPSSYPGPTDDYQQRARQTITDVMELDTAAVIPIGCEECGADVYHVATTGYDLLVVLLAEKDEFEYAVRWHRAHECQAVSA